MELLNTNEAAKKMGVTAIRVRQLIREGKLEARQIGRDYVIEAGSLDSVKTYGKAGRPKETGGKSKPEKAKSFKTIFDMEAESGISLAGSLDSGLGDLSTNKKYLEGFGTKAGEKRALLKRNENNR